MTTKAIILINPLGGMCEFRDYSKANGLKIVSIYTPSKAVLAQRMGQNVDNLVALDCHSIFSDDVAVIMSLLTPLGLAFKAVVPCHECGVEVGAKLAKALKLNHNAVDSMYAARDKRLMRQRVHDSGLSSPSFSIVENVTQIDQFLALHSYPLVIKTPMGGGTSNVFVCRHRDDVLKGYERI